MKAPDRSVRWSRGFVCSRLFFSFAVWWNLWLRCETEPSVRELLKSWQFFVVLYCFSALIVMMCVACGKAALNGLSRLVPLSVSNDA